MAWSGTPVNMEIDGADLVLMAGCEKGSYETPAAKRDLGELCFHHFSTLLTVTDSPSGQGNAGYKLEIKTSEDDVAWTSYVEYRDGERYCRYFYLRVTVQGDIARGQTPYISVFETDAPPTDTIMRQSNVVSTANAPPGTLLLGETYLVGTAAAGGFAGYDNWLAKVVDATNAVFRFVFPYKGMIIFHDTDNKFMVYTEDSEWVDYDLRKNCNGHIEVIADSYNALSPAAGTWGLTIDVGFILNFKLENYSAGLPADQDYATFYLCLSIGTYTLEAMMETGVDYGIVDFDLTGPATIAAASFDCYAAAGPNKNVRKTQTAISITRHGLYLCTVKVDGKNGASAGFKIAMSKICFWRTA